MSNTAILTKVNDKWAAVFQGKVLCRSGDRSYVIQAIESGASPKARQLNVTKIRESIIGTATADTPVSETQEAKVTFSINERFDFLATLARMVIAGTAPSLLVTGPGGYGKTYSVLAEVKAANLTFTTDFEDAADREDEEEGDGGDDDDIPSNPADCHIVKGFSTAKGLYRTLWENNGKLIIFDDCDSIFRNQDAVNILKGALDSYDERWISWNAEARIGDKNPPPRKFLFTGRIIFISNYSQAQIDGAIKSRCLRVDLEMTSAEKIERMTTIVKSGRFMDGSGIPQKTQMQAVQFLDKYKDDATELSMRTLISVTKIIVNAQETGDNNWERLALYNLTA